MIRPKFNVKSDELIDEDYIKQKGLGAKEIIVEQLKKYNNDDVTQLAINLYEYLSKDKIEESEDLIKQFYNDFYNSTKNEIEIQTEEKVELKAPQKKSESIQETFNEVLK